MKKKLLRNFLFLACYLTTVLSCEWVGNQTGGVDSDDDGNYARDIGVWEGSSWQYLLYNYAYYLSTNTYSGQNIQGLSISAISLSFYTDTEVELTVAYPDEDTVILETNFVSSYSAIVFTNFTPFIYDWTKQLIIHIEDTDIFGGLILDAEW